ncbi:response regulator transcription factor [Paraburkholderia azotifigens]|uniref:Response regulator n=1 Tax=Paraburkholderia azotifigens TaxID=2057004 RepID=A0ABU9QZG7_9BURK
MREVAARVYVVDDDASVCRSLARLIQSHGYDVETFCCASEFIGRSDLRDTPGCVVLDVQLPDANGLEMLVRIDPRLPVIFLTGHGDIPMTVRALKAGATDFLTKPVQESILMPAIGQAVMQSSELVQRIAVLEDFRSRAVFLTCREREVMDLVVSGMLNKEIADRLGTSEKTVKAHRGKVMHKMKVTSVAELVRAADRIGDELAAPVTLSPHAGSGHRSPTRV